MLQVKLHANERSTFPLKVTFRIFFKISVTALNIFQANKPRAISFHYGVSYGDTIQSTEL